MRHQGHLATADGRGGKPANHHLPIRRQTTHPDQSVTKPSALPLTSVSNTLLLAQASGRLSFLGFGSLIVCYRVKEGKEAEKTVLRAGVT